MGVKCPKCGAENPETLKFCGECGTQLKSIRAETRTLRTFEKDSTIGEIVSDKYKLLEELGSGGMGIVYKAEQKKPVKRSVALKIIKLGMDTKQVVARFETERQALAVMDHPNIAKVYDGGATESGRPYFVMELVRGIPITDYCDKHKLTTKERLELFMNVCQAVQHAHQKGIIHRDLKPSNILIVVQEEKHIPKIIDFGIAKATEHSMTERTLFTEQGQLIGTPEYMSPEQAEMSGLDVDTRTDIYSLGVILYELIVGVLPFDPETLRKAGLGEIQRIIRETNPPKASTRLSSLGDTQTSIALRRGTDVASLQKQLKGELDWIMMKAMAKDRTQRYSSASEFAADIGRYLRHEPVLAGPLSTMYRLRKFVKRHKLGVAAVAILIITISIGITGTTIGLIRARQAELVAKKEATKAKAINKFLQDTLGSANPIEGNSRNVTVLEALKTATDRINEAFSDQPEVEAEIKQTIGLTYLRLGHYEEAERLLRSSLKMWQDLRGQEHPDLAAPVTSLAVLRHERGDYEEAESLYRSALLIKRREHGGDENEDVLNILNNLALLLQDKGDFVAAEPIFRKILKIDRKIFGREHLYVAIDLNNLGRFLKLKKNYVESELLLRESIDILRKEQHPWLSIALGNLGELLTEKGDYQDAELIFEEALTIGKKQLGEQNQDLAKLRSKYGLCLTKLNHFEKAEEQLLAALPILLDSLGEYNEWTQMTISYLINLYTAWDKEAKANEYRAFLSSKS
jgi:serine/threonine protein kinase/Flp pilus assembly protein TadD